MSDVYPPRSVRALGVVPGTIGRSVIGGVSGLGRLGLFLARGLASVVARPFRGYELVEHMEFIGARSAFLILLTAVFTGMVLTLQSYVALARFGSEAFIGPLVALSLIKELGPVLAALMITARAGSAMTATMGHMRNTEQIDALETMAVDPTQYLVGPRIAACVVSTPLATALFCLCGIGAAYSFGVLSLGIDGGVFLSSMRDSVEGRDVAEMLVKSAWFGMCIAWLACYRGFFTEHSALGVGRATSRAVVETSAIVLISDYVITALLAQPSG